MFAVVLERRLSVLRLASRCPFRGTAAARPSPFAATSEQLQVRDMDPLGSRPAVLACKRTYVSSSQNAQGEPDLTLERLGHAGSVAWLTMNKPERLNALSLPMIHSMWDALRQHFPPAPRAQESGYSQHLTRRPTGDDLDEPRLLVLGGAGGRAFCAGGDVRPIAESKSLGPGVAGTLRCDFFREEYRLDYLLARIASEKTILSVWDGIVMGGGVGISVHGSFRVVTEDALFAMPEAVIGLIPDVGAAYVLSRLPGGLGQYLGLTGARLKAGDLLHCGLATHMVPRKSLGDLKEALISDGGCDPGAVLTEFCVEGFPERSVLAKNRSRIDDAFRGAASVEEIVRRLEDRIAGKGPAAQFTMGDVSEEDRRAGQEWARETLNGLCKGSPTALKATHRHISRAADHNLRWCFEQDFRIVQHLMTMSDFGEGVRALLVDKDKRPAWSPPTLEGVSNVTVEALFAGLGDNELDLTFDE